MKSIPFFQSDGLYVAASFASANTFFFSKETECEILHNNLRRYLGQMIDIVELRCFPGGWILLFRTKSTRLIKQTYFRINKDKETPRFEDVEHILSEQFRIANSMTVRSCNSQCNRSGSRIHSTLIKMIFDSNEEYELFLDKIAKIEVFTNQNLISFYPEFGRVVEGCGMEVTDFKGKMGRRGLQKRVRKLKKYYGRLSRHFREYLESIQGAESKCFKRLSGEVALNLILKTKIKHNFQLKPKFSIFGVP